MSHGPSVVGQEEYKFYAKETAHFLKNSFKKSLNEAELTRVDDFQASPVYGGEMGVGVQTTNPRWEWDFLTKNQEAQKQERLRHAMAKKYIKDGIFKGLHAPRLDALSKAGVTTALGFNFYDLRAPVALLYPVNTPFRNSLPRIGRVNSGVGDAAHWQAVTNPGYGVFAGVSEGNRNAIATPNDIPYTAIYKELGGERSATFTSQYAAEGYADVLADQHIMGLQTLFLQQEGIMLNGNSGASPTGFKLGTCATPTGTAVATHTVGAAGNIAPGLGDLPYTTAITANQYVAVACVLLTAQGNPANLQYGYGTNPTIANGLTPQYQRINADGSKDQINGGISAVSALSTPVQLTGSSLTLSVSVTPTSPNGVFGYAWYVSVQASSGACLLSNAYLAGITYNPTCFVTGTATGTQAANYSNLPSNGALSSDNSYNSLEYDGLITYSASTPGVAYTDLKGATLTSQKNGRVTQIETILSAIFAQYQCGIDKMWCDSYAAQQLDQAIRYSGTSVTGYQFMYSRDSQNNLLGGFVVSGYQSRYAVNNPLGANIIPICIHPMVPPGTIYFELSSNPWPGDRIPFTRGMLVQRDYYSIEWPVVTRSWSFGTYVHEVLAEYTPFIPSTLTGIGPFVGS